MRRIREQIDYGNAPERMDPNLERKLGDVEGLYSKNPAMKKGAQDVQRLVSNRFQKVADKLRQVTGIENLSSKQVQGMVYQEMMGKLSNIMRIESNNREELEELAIESCLDEAEVPSNWYEIDAQLNRSAIDTSDFRYKEDEPEEDEEEEENEEPEYPSFDIEDLTDEEELELEKHKRNIVNAIIQGAAKKGHYIFQKPEIKSKLDAIDPSLYSGYLGIMAINDFLYFTMDNMIEAMSQSGQGVAGKVQVKQKEGGDDEEGEDGEEGGETPDTVIVAQGMIFPILCHEIIKGLEEAKGRHSLPKKPRMAQKVMGQTDILSNEPMQLRIGPEIVEKLRNALPDEMFNEENKGLINWFHILLYQIEAKEFLEIIGNAISQDVSKVRKATKVFEELIQEAKTMKQEFEDYKEEEGIDTDDDGYGDDDDEEGLDDFLGSLGISRPK
jgi:hypothetical protein